MTTHFIHSLVDSFRDNIVNAIINELHQTKQFKTITIDCNIKHVQAPIISYINDGEEITLDSITLRFVDNNPYLEFKYTCNENSISVSPQYLSIDALLNIYDWLLYRNLLLKL